jgi:hypothetical protein
MLSFILHVIAAAALLYAGMRIERWRTKSKRRALKKRVTEAKGIAANSAFDTEGRARPAGL